LVVDDEANARAALSEILREEGYFTETAADGFKALGKLEEFAPDVVLTDLNMPGLDGIAFMEKARSASPHTVFVVMTAYGSIASAVAAIKKGAENYLTKPLDYDALQAVVDRAMEKATLLQETFVLRDRLRERNALGHIVTEDPHMRRVLDLVAHVGPTDTHVLITGETGTGKELIAEALCAASSRASKPFVRLYCGALTELHMDSELFGHERGAVAGATARREGRIAQAAGGTLFLDEVGGIPLGTQAKLLRYLETGSFERVGGEASIEGDVRLIAATNCDLKREIERGTFREDLYFRLSEVVVELPALRDKPADVVPIAKFFLRRYARENGRSIDGIKDRALRVLQHYDWPGNVRELEHVIARAVALCDAPQIDIQHLPPSLIPSTDREGTPRIPGSTISELERYAILKTLEACGGATSKAATILGISPRKIQYKLHEYSVTSGATDGTRVD
jgi:DNA-binding NtrC family response regulator